MNITKEVAERFADFVMDWDYEQYVLSGGYGSGKSYQVALKIILKCLQEKRKVLVVREVYETIRESCFDLFMEILLEMELLADQDSKQDRATKVTHRNGPMQFKFPNGSRIIFKGMDKPEKVKSINGVSIVWLEEASEIKYSGYKELLGRIRTPHVSLHFILSFNPVGRENWVYRHFFKRMDDNGVEHTILDEELFYYKKTVVKNGVYYHHSTPDDNPFLPKEYIKRLDDIQEYDEPLYRVARHGRFGAAGVRVLPQFRVAKNADEFKKAVQSIPWSQHYFGFDFGFEESYNAVISMAVDEATKTLYIYDEIYANKLTDPEFEQRPEMKRLKMKLDNLYDENAEKVDRFVVADNEDPKAISYYRGCGWKIRGCKNKFAGSRLSNTRKVKRFARIVCSPKCKNTIRELKDLTYKRDAKGNAVYDEFNIDPHTFSAIWYGLDTCIVTDVKSEKRNSKAG